MSPETFCDTPPPPAADELEARVRRQVRGYVRNFRLVEVGNGLVLRGSARSYYAKQLAQQAVMAAASFRIAANEIEVAAPPDGQAQRPSGDD